MTTRLSCYFLNWLIVFYASAFAHDPVSQLETQLLEKRSKLMQQLADEISDADKRKVADAFRSFVLDAIDQMLVLAEKVPSDGTGLMASVAIVRNCDAGYAPHIKATQILLDHHLDYPQMASLCQHFVGLEPVYEAILRKVLASNAPQAQTCASYALAEILFQRADLKDELDARPDLRQKWIANGDQLALAAIESSTSQKDRIDALRLYEKVIQEGSAIETVNGTLSSKAEERASLLRGESYLTVGSTAPNLSGSTIDGTAIDLRDHLGSVITVTFWASWCGPCLARMPEKMELYERLKERGFVLIGVNADDSLDAARSAIDNHNINFDSIWDDPNGEDRVVIEWGIRSWPTTIVIDQNGIIKSRYLSEEIVEQLLDAGATDTRTKGEP